MRRTVNLPQRTVHVLPEEEIKKIFRKDDLISLRMGIAHKGRNIFPIGPILALAGKTITLKPLELGLPGLGSYAVVTEMFTKEGKEIYYTRAELVYALKQYCHDPGCRFIRSCPEECNCGEDPLDLDTAIAWLVARQLEYRIDEPINNVRVVRDAVDSIQDIASPLGFHVTKYEPLVDLIDLVLVHVMHGRINF